MIKYFFYTILFMLGIGFVGFFFKFLNVAGDNVIFENSYQKKSAENGKYNSLMAEKTGLRSRLNNPSLTPTQRSNIKAQLSAVNYQLNAMGN